MHAVAVNPSDDAVLLGTHDGLFELQDGDGRPRRIGPVIDLMGFTVVGPDHFYASGHPGPGADLPNPVGLIESVDGGRTWTPVSRAGESDFHALTATPMGLIAYGSQLEHSRDGTEWAPLTTPARVFDVAAAPDGNTVVVTTEAGPSRSTDAGATWQRLDAAPLLAFIEWTGPAELLGVTRAGQVHVSPDAGDNWHSRGTVAGQPQALGVVRGDSIRVLIARPTAFTSPSTPVPSLSRSPSRGRRDPTLPNRAARFTPWATARMDT